MKNQKKNTIRTTTDVQQQNGIQKNDVISSVNDDTIEVKPPSRLGEESVSGDMPSPEADDDTLQNAQDAGFQLGEDEEHPKEIDAARDIDAAEEYQRTH